MTTRNKNKNRNDAAIYLYRSGRTEGPFTDEDFGRLRAEGRLRDYSWYWDDRKSGWRPVDPPPTQAPTCSAESAPRLRVVPELRTPGISALCYNRKQMLSGELIAITREGCAFRGISKDSAAPFPPDSQIVLNLFNAAAGRSMSLLANVASITRDLSGWTVQLRLDEDLPSELFEGSELAATG